MEGERTADAMDGNPPMKHNSDFEQFASDMGPRPDGYSIERVNNELGYNPGNCVWASCRDQQNNRACNILVTVGTETLTVMQWAKRMGVPHARFYGRLKRGWDKTTAIMKPARANNRRKPM